MTQAQKTAADPSHSVWVGASAGTGKTKVLTDRVLRLLLQGVSPSKILCLTYTKAAAAEMATRIQEKLGEWAIEDDDALYDHILNLTNTPPDQTSLTRARRLFVQLLDAQPSLNIKTIHAFCQSLVSRFPLEAGISPQATIMDSNTTSELLHEAKLRLLSSSNAQDHALSTAIKALTWRLYDGSFTDLLKTIIYNRSNLTHLFQYYDCDQLINTTYAALGAIQDTNEEDIISTACDSHAYNHTALQNAVGLLLEGSKTDNKYGAIIANWLAADQKQRIASIDFYLSVFFKTDGGVRDKLVTKKLSERDPSIDITLKNEQERLIRFQEQRKSQRIAALTSHIIHIGEALLVLYQDLKQQKGLLDYDDLIQITLKLLSNSDTASWVLYKLDSTIEHLLIDEAQDTSPQQWHIIQALCNEWFAGDGSTENPRSLFVVGDEKQSIYSFQGADVHSFNTMHSHYASVAKQAAHSWHSIALDRSFRSTEPILQAVDTVFSDEALKKAVSFSELDIQHIPHRTGHAGIVEIWPPLAPSNDVEEILPWTLPTEMRPMHDTSQQLAEKIAETIGEWITSKRLLPSKNRPVQAGDIMILVRRRNQLVEHMIRSLKKRSIPVTGMDRMILTDHIAVMDMVALGNFLLLPSDDLMLATVLKTPLFGLSEEQLFALAYNREENSLWQRLKAEHDKNPSYSHAYDSLSSLLNKTDFCTPFTLYNTVLEVQNGRKQMIQRLGHEANDVLDEFLALALEYEKIHTPSLQGFLHWLTTSNQEIKRDMDQSSGEIRIMTIHGSKGLQAPIVFLPDTMQVPSNRNTFLWSDDTPSLLFWSGSQKQDNALCSQLREAEKIKSYQEYIRLLYVAMTRPEDELYICGAQNKNKPPKNCWYNVVREALSDDAESIDIGEDIPLLRISSQQTAPMPSYSANKTIETATALPAYFTTPAPEEKALPTHVAPSRADIDDNKPLSDAQYAAMIRGTFTHLLLEQLPLLSPAQQIDYAKNAAKPYNVVLSDTEIYTIIQATQAVLKHPDFSALFSSDSRAEVSVSGEINGQIVSGQIDRLVIKDNVVLIVDYKTGDTPPETPESIPVAYLKQMALYAALLRQIYPDHTIRTALLWTKTLTLMSLSENLLMRYSPAAPLTSVN